VNSLKGHHVVVADSNVDWRKNIRLLLNKAGCLVVGEAADGVTAIKMIRDRQPDVVIIDVGLAGMSGIEVAEIIYEDKLASVILTVERYQSYLLTKAKNLGVKSLLVKPFGESVLIPAVELALSSYAEMVELERKLKQMEEKLETRKIIERAKGILMETTGMSEAQAFKRIQKQSMDKRISMRAIAEAIIMTHELKSV